MCIICPIWAVLGVYGSGICDRGLSKLVYGMVYVDTLCACMCCTQCTPCTRWIEYSKHYSTVEPVYDTTYTVIVNTFTVWARVRGESYPRQ